MGTDAIERWLNYVKALRSDWRPFDAQWALYRELFDREGETQTQPAAWIPEPEQIAYSNLGQFMHAGKDPGSFRGGQGSPLAARGYGRCFFAGAVTMLINNLNYSRAKIGTAIRKWLMSCSELLRLGHDEVDVLRLARPKGKDCR